MFYLVHCEFIIVADIIVVVTAAVLLIYYGSDISVAVCGCFGWSVPPTVNVTWVGGVLYPLGVHCFWHRGRILRLPPNIQH